MTTSVENRGFDLKTPINLVIIVFLSMLDGQTTIKLNGKTMKRILFVLICITFMSVDVSAQDKKASFGLGVGGASASAKDLDGIKDKGFGFNFYINAMYNISDNLSAGFEYNANAVVIGSIDPSFNAELKATRLNGYLLKGRYYLGTGSARPFGGVMVGLYNIKPGEISSTTGSLSILLDPKIVFGFAPEVGVVFNNFQLATSYHFPGKYKGEISGTAIESTYSMWQFNIGWNIGLMDN